MRRKYQGGTVTDDDALDGSEVLPLERTVDKDMLTALDGMSRSGLNSLSGVIRDRWYDVWIGDDEPEPVDENAAALTTARLSKVHDGQPYFELREGRSVVDAVVEQLEPVWSIDSAEAESLYLSLWMGIGELATRSPHGPFGRFPAMVRRLAARRSAGGAR